MLEKTRHRLRRAHKSEARLRRRVEQLERLVPGESQKV